MSMDCAISVENAGKAYRIWETPASRLTAPLLESAAGLLPAGPGRWMQEKAAESYRDFWALRDVTFSVRRGEAVGIIGRNGSGKSTLLQMIAGTLRPTCGTVRVNGRVAALLELGSGFNPDFTGRENVFLNAAVLGLSRAETTARFGAITDFADIGAFIDQPVKTYSSGMMMRLAFATQTAIEPEILIVDEALSVGDFYFQQKCFKRIAELRTRGTTLLFVSHDMASVRDLCSRALYLRKGQAIHFGESQGAIARYYREDDPAAATETAPPAAATAAPASLASAELAAAMVHAIWKQEPAAISPDAAAGFLAIEIMDEQGRPALKHRMGSSATIRGYVRAQRDTKIHLALELKNRHGQLVSSLGTRLAGCGPVDIKAGETWCMSAQIRLGLESGLYSFQLGLGTPHVQPNLGVRFAESPWLGPLTIDWDYTAEQAPFLGMFDLPAKIQVARVN
jgi:lipopolysaccharide transport system ATP-binding protein